MNKSAELKAQLLVSNYSKYAKKYNEWKNKYFDDRRLYQNMYEQLLKSLKIMGRIGNSYIWVAFNEQFNKDLKQMDEIIAKFEEIEKAA